MPKNRKCSCNGNCKCGKNPAVTWKDLAKVFEIPDPQEQKSKMATTYRITLSDSGTSDGYFLNFSREISIFEFVELLQTIFGIEVDLGYDETTDETLENSSVIQEFLDALEDDDE